MQIKICYYNTYFFLTNYYLKGFDVKIINSKTLESNCIPNNNELTKCLETRESIYTQISLKLHIRYPQDPILSQILINAINNIFLNNSESNMVLDRHGKIWKIELTKTPPIATTALKKYTQTKNYFNISSNARYIILTEILTEESLNQNCKTVIHTVQESDIEIIKKIRPIQLCNSKFFNGSNINHTMPIKINNRTFEELDLSNLKLDESEQCTFDHCHLRNTCLDKMNKCYFINCYLNVDCTNAKITNCSFIDCVINYSNFNGAKINQSIFESCTISFTIFPPNYNQSNQFKENRIEFPR